MKYQPASRYVYRRLIEPLTALGFLLVWAGNRKRMSYLKIANIILPRRRPYRLCLRDISQQKAVSAKRVTAYLNLYSFRKLQIFDPYFKKSFVRFNPNFGLAPASHITRTLARLHRVHPDNPLQFFQTQKNGQWLSFPRGQFERASP